MEADLYEERVSRQFILDSRVFGYTFQPGDFGHQNIGEFEAIGILSSPFPHSTDYIFYVVYANARHERLLIRYEVDSYHEVQECERYRYSYQGAEAY